MLNVPELPFGDDDVELDNQRTVAEIDVVAARVLAGDELWQIVGRILRIEARAVGQVDRLRVDEDGHARGCVRFAARQRRLDSEGVAAGRNLRHRDAEDRVTMEALRLRCESDVRRGCCAGVPRCHVRDRGAGRILKVGAGRGDAVVEYRDDGDAIGGVGDEVARCHLGAAGRRRIVRVERLKDRHVDHGIAVDLLQVQVDMVVLPAAVVRAQRDRSGTRCEEAGDVVGRHVSRRADAAPFDAAVEASVHRILIGASS